MPLELLMPVVLQLLMLHLPTVHPKLGLQLLVIILMLFVVVLLIVNVCGQLSSKPRNTLGEKGVLLRPI